MKNTLHVGILALVIFGIGAGCSGGYDRELLGDPAPAQPAPTTPPPQEEYAEPALPEESDTMDVGMFADLGFYGTWHWVDPYGWVWRPITLSGWQPLINGHWIWTEYGWMWVSYDPWGWATTHYGYWAVDFTFGWVWIPDYQWSPCQCDWIVYDDYVCWSPVPPPGVKFKEPWQKGQDAWVSVPVRKFKDPDVGQYRTSPKFKVGYSERLLRHSPPDEHEIERIGGKPLTMVQVQLDRTVVGDREFARVKLPPDQERIVQANRTRVKTNSTKARFAPPSYPTTSPTQGGEMIGPPEQTSSTRGEPKGDVRTEPKKKSKSESKPEAKKDSDGSSQKYKAKRAEEKKEEAKKEGKSKDPKPKR